MRPSRKLAAIVIAMKYFPFLALAVVVGYAISWKIPVAVAAGLGVLIYRGRRSGYRPETVGTGRTMAPYSGLHYLGRSSVVCSSAVSVRSSVQRSVSPCDSARFRSRAHDTVEPLVTATVAWAIVREYTLTIWPLTGSQRCLTPGRGHRVCTPGVRDAWVAWASA
jgi:hypothetical protein